MLITMIVKQKSDNGYFMKKTKTWSIIARFLSNDMLVFLFIFRIFNHWFNDRFL